MLAGTEHDGHRVAFVERDGQKFATEIRFEGSVTVAKADLVDYPFVSKLVDHGADHRLRRVRRRRGDRRGARWSKRVRPTSR